MTGDAPTQRRRVPEPEAPARLSLDDVDLEAAACDDKPPGWGDRDPGATSPQDYQRERPPHHDR